MKKLLFNWLVKDYIDQVIDKKFQENAYERYFHARQKNLHERIAKLRHAIEVSSSSEDFSKEKDEIQSSGVLEISNDKERELQISSKNRKINNEKEMQDIKKKLLRGKR